MVSGSWITIAGGDGGYTAVDTKANANPAEDVLFLEHTGLSLQRSTNICVAYATVSTFGVNNLFKTTNGGVSWTPSVGTGITALPQIPVHSVVVNPVSR